MPPRSIGAVARPPAPTAIARAPGKAPPSGAIGRSSTTPARSMSGCEPTTTTCAADACRRPSAINSCHSGTMSGFSGNVVHDKSIALVKSTTIPRALNGRHDATNGLPSWSDSWVAVGSMETSIGSVRNTSTAGDNCGNSAPSVAK